MATESQGSKRPLTAGMNQSQTEQALQELRALSDRYPQAYEAHLQVVQALKNSAILASTGGLSGQGVSQETLETVLREDSAVREALEHLRAAFVPESARVLRVSLATLQQLL